MFAQPVVAFVGDDDTGFFGFNSGVGEIGGVAEGALGDGLEEG